MAAALAQAKSFLCPPCIPPASLCHPSSVSRCLQRAGAGPAWSRASSGASTGLLWGCPSGRGPRGLAGIICSVSLFLYLVWEFGGLLKIGGPRPPFGVNTEHGHRRNPRRGNRLPRPTQSPTHPRTHGSHSLQPKLCLTVLGLVTHLKHVNCD